MGKFAVMDTETNWADQVMSIGTVIADADTFELITAKYHILPIECEIGGMYYSRKAGGAWVQHHSPVSDGQWNSSRHWLGFWDCAGGMRQGA